MKRCILAIAAGLAMTAASHAQGFFNLTAEQVKIDSLLPCFTHVYDLGTDYADSTYTVTIDYPEFIDMSDTDIRRYQNITTDSLPDLPVVNSYVAVARKRGQLDISFIPLVYRDGKYKKLVSFKLTVKGHALPRRAKAAKASSDATSRYADHSVLRSGNWAKIRVSESGIYQLTDALVRQAGFTDASKVKIYGYGGALQPEKLTGDYLASTDDLQEVPTCTIGGKRLFHAQGPVSWTSGGVRERNPYSDYGYYFLTESDDTLATIDSTAFLSTYYPADEDYYSLYEVDNYAWYHSGRNLYDSKILGVGTANNYTLAGSGTTDKGRLRVVLTADNDSRVTVSLNDSVVGTVTVKITDSSGSKSSYEKAAEGIGSFTVSNIQASNTVTLTQNSGGTARLDYISLYSDSPKTQPDLSTTTFPVPEYVYRITNQDHHADESVDMVIIIPTSQTFRSQADRLKALHEEYDGMTVRIVPADELYNEFSSGTPDATAYRRYMKMFYDRAETDSGVPRYLLLFGDGAWDNRLLSTGWQSYSADDFLLCYEGKNSFSEVNSFVTDDFYCMLDDGEEVCTNGQEVSGSSSSYAFRGKMDVAVGRISARTLAQATTAVDKIETHLSNSEAGDWKNTVVILGDDGNGNTHMQAADQVAQIVESLQPTMYVKRIMWDAYERQSSSTGFTYPDVTKLVKQYMSDGALMFNYSGHGRAAGLSHENVLLLNDFSSNVTKHLPLWVTASCDIMPFDGQEENIGETAMFNENGGALAFLGTTRTVYTARNLTMNTAYTRYLFSETDGERLSIGEALRQTKVSLVSGSGDVTMNKMHYVLLGDPSLVLSYPKKGVVVDSINGIDMTGDESVTLKAGSKVSVVGHVETDGQLDSGFNGTLSASVFDAEEQVVCRLNNQSADDGADTKFTYYDRPDIVFSGIDSISKGLFVLNFVVPKDISYSQNSGRLLLYAIDNNRDKEYNGDTENFTLNGSVDIKRDSLGPNVYCYLNSSSFVNGGNVNTTPYFFAEINDDDGINAAGSGIGHNMQLVIDNDPLMTYDLTDYFTFDFGSYQSGSVGYSLSALESGQHKLLFRVWDVLNNSSTSELTFNVVEGAAPSLIDVGCTNNPATTSTSFRIMHDRMGSDVDITVDVLDMSGRVLWTHTETGVSSGNLVTIDWDLTSQNGGRLGTGVYLYRVKAVSDGSSSDSKTKKLIILSNN